MTSADYYWVGPTIGNGSFGQVVYGRYKRIKRGEESLSVEFDNGNNSKAPMLMMGREVAIKVVDKITVTKYPYVLKGLYHERKLILETLQASTSTSTQNDTNDNGGGNDKRRIQADSDDNTDLDPFLPPPVVQIWASFHDSQCLYVVMELATGGDLQSFIDHVFSNNATKAGEGREDSNNDNSHDDVTQQTSPPQQWIEQSVPFYVNQLVHAVNFIHSRHVVHCDLKPGNILLDKTTGRLVLADFASAIIDLNENEGLDASSSSAAAASDPDRNFFIPRGTAEYSSPELLTSSTRSNIDVGDESNLRTEGSANKSAPFITNAVDYWSVGCIIYCMLFGTSPFHRETEALTLDAVMEYVMNKQQKGQGFGGGGEYSSNSGRPSNRFPNSPRTDLPLLRDVHGLLEVDPNQRRSYWSTSYYASDDNSLRRSHSSPLPPAGVILPSPPWKDDLEGYELKDGSDGWVVFQF